MLIEAGRAHELLELLASEAQAEVREEDVAGDGERVIDRIQFAVAGRQPVAEVTPVDFQKAFAFVREHRVDVGPVRKRIESGQHFDDRAGLVLAVESAILRTAVVGDRQDLVGFRIDRHERAAMFAERRERGLLNEGVKRRFDGRIAIDKRGDSLRDLRVIRIGIDIRVRAIEQQRKRIAALPTVDRDSQSIVLLLVDVRRVD